MPENSSPPWAIKMHQRLFFFDLLNGFLNGVEIIPMKNARLVFVGAHESLVGDGEDSNAARFGKEDRLGRLVNVHARAQGLTAVFTRQLYRVGKPSLAAVQGVIVGEIPHVALHLQ